MPPSPPPDPTATEIAQAEKARKRAIYSAIVIAVISATIVPAALSYFFRIPTIGGVIPAAVVYLILQRLFNFDPACPNCGIKVGKSATRCRQCGTQLGHG
ncbi:MAG: zinc ribbon domain-containing protein [Verrucomicrobia bacterium]|nr:zinc ribbon domain-containing protein [Verrucomicrobiota bacterium]